MTLRTWERFFDLQLVSEDGEDDTLNAPISYRYLGSIRQPSTRLLNMTQRPRPMVNWEHVSSWLRGCDLHRECSSQRQLCTQPTGLRVIDVERGCIVDAPPDCFYAALSYVWGVRTGSEQFEATAANLSELEQEGYLLKQGLPATLYDAIVACRKLHIPYLWIDRLCILQGKESSHEAEIQINALGDIYRRSVVTLVAMAGEDACYGLPGVSSKQRDTAISVCTQGIFMIQMHPDYALNLRNSKWSTRSWTFQEAVLSSRLILFSDSNVFFECLHGEGARLGGYEPISVFLTLPVCHRGWCISFQFLFPHAFLPHTRDGLYDKKAILRAFVGILNSKYGSDHYFGLPFCELDRAMLWWPRNGKYPPRIPREGEVLPSWS
ncbi:heterokaryon incompatibility protein-domain-containing protein [Aspergillus pseudonomiae]|uniref:Heterokaryon incompatibility protein-domain-containing protein n=1 Tax=Aspergillus pseudonomiae TaxID=1506151 RepID=A0A5N7DKC3_9EURO|nr:heterokaryon incompatibility protein-domain-containing protein [Aspergillus pseudonomiae]KAE8406891.1 heterokaryon incompatibility protein-domain-containing protein [Aspergillus pseudonomiae]